MDFDDIYKDDYEDLPEEPTALRPGCLRVLFNLAFFLLLPLALVVALLPTLLSSEGGVRWALTRINAVTPGDVAIEKWRLGWLARPVLEEVSYKDARQGLVLKARRISFDRGLLRLLPVGTLNLGEITIEEPDIIVNLAPEAGPIRKPAEQKQDKGGAGFLLPIVDVAGSIHLSNGMVRATGAMSDTFIADQLESHVSLTSWRKPIAIETRTRLGTGVAALEGHLPSIQAMVGSKEHRTENQKLTLTLAEVDLRAARPLLQHFSGQPWIHGGTADGALTAMASGKRRGKIEGGMAVSGLVLEAPGQPRSPRGDIALMASLDYDKEAVDIRKLDFTSPWLRFEALGRVQANDQTAARPTGALNAKATLLLAPVARDFGTLLGLSPAFKVTGGELHADLAFSGGESAMLAEAHARTSGLVLNCAGAPFELKPAPSLDFKVRFPHEGPPELENLRLKTPWADIYAQGGPSAAKLKAEADLTRFSRDAKRIFKECPPMVGAIYLDAHTQPSDLGASLHSFLKLSDVAIELAPGQMTVVSQGTLKFDCHLPLKDQKPQSDLRNATFELTLPNGRLAGKWQRLVPGGASRPTLLRGFSMTSDLEVGALRRLLGGVIPPAAQRHMKSMQGRVLVNATAEAAANALKSRVSAAAVELAGATPDGTPWRIPDIRLDGGTSQSDPTAGLRLELQGSGGIWVGSESAPLFIEPEARATIDATLATDGASIRLDNLTLNSALVDLRSTGAITDLPFARRAKLSGSIAVDMQNVMHLLEGQGLDAFTLSGRQPRDFTFNAPLAHGLNTILAEGEALVPLHLSSCKGLGLNAGPADAVVQLSGGTLKLSYLPALNSGQLRLVPALTVGGRGSGILTMPPGTRLLESVKITQELVDNLLVNINPLLQGSRVLDGTLSLDLRHCRGDLSQPPEKGVALDMDLEFTNLKMELGPPLRELLSYVKVKIGHYEVRRLPLHVVVRDGRIHLAPVKMEFDGQPLVFSGWVGFDERISYLIEVPVTERLVGKAAGKMLQGATVKIPVTGTIAEQRLDTRALQNMLGNMLKSAIGEQALEKVGSFLENLQRELSK